MQTTSSKSSQHRNVRPVIPVRKGTTLGQVTDHSGGESRFACARACRSVLARLDSCRIGEFGFVKHDAQSRRASPLDTGNSMSPKRVLLCELRPQPAEAFRARFWHPTKTSAEEGVFLFAFEIEPAGFFVEATEFLCELHPLGKSLGEG